MWRSRACDSADQPVIPNGGCRAEMLPWGCATEDDALCFHSIHHLRASIDSAVTGLVEHLYADVLNIIYPETVRLGPSATASQISPSNAGLGAAQSPTVNSCVSSLKTQGLFLVVFGTARPTRIMLAWPGIDGARKWISAAPYVSKLVLPTHVVSLQGMTAASTACNPHCLLILRHRSGRAASIRDSGRLRDDQSN